MIFEFVESKVEPGATVYTDDSRACSNLPNSFDRFSHETIKHVAGEYTWGDAHTNCIKAFRAVLKRSIEGIWHQVSPKHLGGYVNEATFPLNGGNPEVDTIVRMEKFARGVGGKRPRYTDLVA